MRNRRTWAALALILLWAGTALAQESRGRVQGLVSDRSGGVTPGATVVLKSDATGVEVTRVTSSAGRYLFDYVDPGTFTLTVTLPGFKTAV